MEGNQNDPADAHLPAVWQRFILQKKKIRNGYQIKSTRFKRKNKQIRDALLNRLCNHRFIVAIHLIYLFIIFAFFYIKKSWMGGITKKFWKSNPKQDLWVLHSTKNKKKTKTCSSC
jgi:hypothetical protein